MDEEKKRKFLFVVLFVLVAILIGLLFVIYRQVDNVKPNNEETLDTFSQTEVNENLSVTYNLASKEADSDIIADVRDVANRFMEAKLERDLESAKKYMSEELAKSTTQDESTGPSSPKMDSFEITSAQAVKTPFTYKVEVLSYWKIDGEDAPTVKYDLIIKKIDDKYLVISFK